MSERSYHGATSRSRQFGLHGPGCTQFKLFLLLSRECTNCVSRNQERKLWQCCYKYSCHHHQHHHHHHHHHQCVYYYYYYIFFIIVIIIFILLYITIIIITTIIIIYLLINDIFNTFLSKVMSASDVLLRNNASKYLLNLRRMYRVRR